MRVIILDDNRSERDAMARLLECASCSVEPMADVKVALAAIARDAPQVLVLSWSNGGGDDLVRLARGSDASGQMYVIALLDSTAGAADVTRSIAAGAHDVLRRPIVDAELVARLQGPARFIEWAQSVTKPEAFRLGSALDVGRLAVWKNMGDLVAADLAEMVGERTKACPGWPQGFGPDLHGAVIPMSLASEQVEVRIAVMADTLALKWLARALLGDPDADAAALDDVLRELANTAGGAVKRAALPEKVTLTTGMPINESKVRFHGVGIQSWTLPLDGGKVRLAIVGEIRSRKNQRLPASSLREGMVLVNDLRSESGTLLVPAGLRLTCTAAARVAQMLGPRFLVDVARTA